MDSFPLWLKEDPLLLCEVTQSIGLLSFLGHVLATLGYFCPKDLGSWTEKE